MGKWIDYETDASTGKPYLWKCDECGEEVTTRWNYCPECGDPKTSKGENINTLVKALEAEHKRLKELQNLATDKNVGSKNDELEIVRAISGLTEWQKHVQANSDIDRDISVAIRALKAQLGTNLAEVGTDCISRQAAIDIAKELIITINGYEQYNQAVNNYSAEIMQLPPAQPEQSWIPCSERLPKSTEAVNVTWVNRKPEFYYSDIKDKPYTAPAVYFRGKWYWYSCVIEDWLDEYGSNESFLANLQEAVDRDIEIIAWQPLPKPWEGSTE